MGWRVRTTEEVTIVDRRAGPVTLPPGAWDLYPDTARPLIDEGKAVRIPASDPEYLTAPRPQAEEA